MDLSPLVQQRWQDSLHLGLTENMAITQTSYASSFSEKETWPYCGWKKSSTSQVVDGLSPDIFPFFPVFHSCQ